MYVINRPQPLSCIEWTGANYVAVVAFVPPGSGLTVKPDGTLTDGLRDFAVGTCFYDTGDALSPEAQVGLRQSSSSPDVYVLDSTLPGRLSGLGFAPPKATRRATVAVPGIALLGRQTVAVTWSSPMPSADYDIVLTQFGSAGALGNVAMGVVSQTAAGCVLGFYAVLALSVGTLSVKVLAVEP